MQLSLAKAPSLSDWRPLSFLSNYYMQLLGRRQTLCVRLEASLSSICYIQVLERRHPLCQIGGLFLAYLAVRCNSLWRRHSLERSFQFATCNSCGEGTLSVRFEASLFSICYIQLLERRHTVCQIRGLSLSYLAAICN